MLSKLKLNTCENPSCNNRSWVARFKTSDGIRLGGRWHCKIECFEQGLEQIVTDLSAAAMRRQDTKHRLPLGLLMLSEGWISEENLRAALEAQRHSADGRIGEWFLRLGIATEQQITNALARQWSRPVFSIDSASGFLQCASLIPFTILESALMVPVHYLSQRHLLYVAFAREIDYTVLYGVEQMLNCRTEPCLAKQSSVLLALDQIRQHPRPIDICFDSIHDAKEIVHAAVSYTAKLRPDEVRVSRCGGFLWMQFLSQQQTSNLLFNVFSQHDTPALREDF